MMLRISKIITLLGACALLGISSPQAEAGNYTASENASWTIITNDFSGGVSRVGQQIFGYFGDSVNENFPLYTDSGEFEVDAFRRYQTWVGGGAPDDPTLYEATVNASDKLGKEAWKPSQPGASVWYSGTAEVGGVAYNPIITNAAGYNTYPESGSVDCALNGTYYAHLPGNMKIDVTVSCVNPGHGHHWGELKATFPTDAL
jgi:hypothetical protein